MHCKYYRSYSSDMLNMYNTPGKEGTVRPGGEGTYLTPQPETINSSA